MFLEGSGKYRLVSQLHKAKDGEISARIWRLPAGVQLSDEARQAVYDVMIPIVVLKEEDIFLVDETFDLEADEALGPWDHSYVMPVQSFDSDEL